MPDDPFYRQPAWWQLRGKALKRDGYRCVNCHADVRGKGQARVDHIETVKDRPDLALVLRNVRTLCTLCDGARHADRWYGTTRPAIGIDGYPLEGPAAWGSGKRGK